MATKTLLWSSKNMKLTYSSIRPRFVAAPLPKDHWGDTPRVRTGTEEDIGAVTRIHQAAFPHALMSHLGQPFLKRYYRQVLTYSGGIFLVISAKNEVSGFVSGVLRPEHFYRKMVFASWRFFPPLLQAFIARPSLLYNIYYSLGRVLRSTERNKLPGRCELSSIAVAPDQAGQGLGAELTRAFLHESWQRGAHVVCLTTDAEENEAVNRFYEKLGFHVQRTFRQCGGCLTNEYVYQSPPFEQGRTC